LLACFWTESAIDVSLNMIIGNIHWKPSCCLLALYIICTRPRW